MNEDSKLNDFLKERLEADVSGEPPRLDAILHAASAAVQARMDARRRSVRLWGGLLAAASLAVLCLFAVHLRVPPTTPSSPHQVARPVPSQSLASMPSPEQTLVSAIDLLSMAAGVVQKRVSGSRSMRGKVYNKIYEYAVSGNTCL